MNNKKQISGLLGIMLPVVVLILMTASATSCGKDDPEFKVGYYMSINSTESFMASQDDEDQGTMSESPDGNVLYTTITRMKRALHDAYPAPGYQGNDVGVLVACDSIYRMYKRLYGEYEKNTICVVKIIRTSLNDDGIVVGSRTLTTYKFGSLPPGKDYSQM